MKPLSQHAMNTLRAIAYSPMPAQELNPGLVRKLLGLELIRLESRASPYSSHPSGKRIDFAVATERGVAVGKGDVRDEETIAKETMDDLAEGDPAMAAWVADARGRGLSWFDILALWAAGTLELMGPSERVIDNLAKRNLDILGVPRK